MIKSEYCTEGKILKFPSFLSSCITKVQSFYLILVAFSLSTITAALSKFPHDSLQFKTNIYHHHEWKPQLSKCLSVFNFSTRLQYLSIHITTCKLSYTRLEMYCRDCQHQDVTINSVQTCSHSLLQDSTWRWASTPCKKPDYYYA